MTVVVVVVVAADVVVFIMVGVIWSPQLVRFSFVVVVSVVVVVAVVATILVAMVVAVEGLVVRWNCLFCVCTDR